MSYLIAVSGKGGVGKTTIAALIINRLIRHNCKPVLAVDADPNTCLDAALGVRAVKTIGGIREEARIIAGQGMAAGVSKQQMLEMKIAESLIESDDFDCIAMGRCEGAGCYCYANNVLKQALVTMTKQYPYVVLDNEAGMENLSRRIVQKVNCLVMVSDPSMRGIETLRRLHALTAEMSITYDTLALIINRVRVAQLPAHVLQLKDSLSADFLIALPEDEQIAVSAEEGKSIFTLQDICPVIKPIDTLIHNLIPGI